jgi:hypothetical protein
MAIQIICLTAITLMTLAWIVGILFRLPWEKH